MNSKRKQELDDKWKQVAAQAVTRDDFKHKLAADPVAVLGEFEIRLPEGVDAKAGSDGAIKLFPPEDASEPVLEEVQWWRWRLDMIRQFGRDDGNTGHKMAAPDAEDEDV